MACSKYQYVKKFQQPIVAMLETFIIVRIDGRSFTKFCSQHNFQKPNDMRAIGLMNKAAEFVIKAYLDIYLAYGQSDQYSFAFKKNTIFFNRRLDKILSTVVSAFSSAYVYYWKDFFDISMKIIPTFDSRAIVYPNQKCLKDYFRWRQVDCHINNLYNTTFWALVKEGQKNTEVQQFLKDTNSGQKNEILFSKFNINYNKLPQIQRKGSIWCYRTKQESILQIKQEISIQSMNLNQQKKYKKENQQEKQQTNIEIDIKKNKKKQKNKQQHELQFVHQDLIKEQFWNSIKF